MSNAHIISWRVAKRQRGRGSLFATPESSAIKYARFLAHGTIGICVTDYMPKNCHGRIAAELGGKDEDVELAWLRFTSKCNDNDEP